MTTFTDEKIRAKFEALLEEGRKILAACRHEGQELHRWPSDLTYKSYLSQATNLIEKVCGRQSAHFAEITRKESFSPVFIGSCVGVLQGAQRDFADGFLSDIRFLVRAEFLDDVLGQADALLEQGYCVAAASLAGAVLEDTLRKLCDKHSIAYGSKTNINALNTELAKAVVYDKLVQKRITAEADLRNSADHGHFGKVKPEDVADMLRWVRRFVEEHLR